MSTDQRPSAPSSFRRTVMEELQSLLSSLLGLYSQISSRILTDRLNTRQESTMPREGIPIGALLDEKIDQSAAAIAQNDGSASEEKPSDTSPASRSQSITAGKEPRPGRSGSGFFGALSGYFGRHRSSAHSEPVLGEKMRANTLAHINKATMLAKRGDAKGAKVHATLAESAMRTAGEYMSDEEYARFKEQVQSRIEAASRPAQETKPAEDAP